MSCRYTAYLPTALAQNAPPQSRYREPAPPKGKLFPPFPHGEGGPTHRPEGKLFSNLPLRGRGTAAAVDEGPRTTGRYTITGRSRPLRPSSVSLTRASTTFYGIAATGSYVRFNSLRAAPPVGEAFSNLYKHLTSPNFPILHLGFMIPPVNRNPNKEKS